MNFEANDNLEKLFEKFKTRVGEDIIDEKVDYLGINILDDRVHGAEFKLYYTDAFSRKQTHPLVEFLSNESMVRYLTMVNDKDNYMRLRFDIGIKNRTNINIEKMFEWLDKNVELFQKNKIEIKRLSSMKMTNREGFDFASLYFIGFISTDNKINVLKFHFYNRICDDPDNLYDNYKFDDDYYLDYLKSSGIRGFSSLVDIIILILQHCGGHLWMTGIDYKIDGTQKYKIYIKHPQKLYDGLLSVFSDNKNKILRKKIEDVRVWNDNHSSFKCEGFAICLNNKNEISINFYYIIKHNQTNIIR